MHSVWSDKKLGCCEMWDIRPKLILDSNLVNSRSSITTALVTQSFWNFTHNMVVILPCSVQKLNELVYRGGGDIEHRFGHSVNDLPASLSISGGKPLAWGSSQYNDVVLPV